MSNNIDLKTEYKRGRRALKFKWRTQSAARRHAYKMKRQELKFRMEGAPREERRTLKKALRQEKRAFKKEAYLQKSIYLEGRAALKKKRLEAQNSMTKLVREHAPESLTGRLTLSYILIFLIFTVLQGAFVVTTAYYIIDRRADETVRTVAGALQAAKLDPSVAAALADEYDMNITLSNAGGASVYSFGMTDLQAQLPYNSRWDRPFSFRYQAEDLRIYSVWVEYGGARCTLNLAKRTTAESALLSIMVNLLLLSIALAGSISYFVGHRLTRKLLRPIGVLGRAMEEMSAAHLSDRLDTADIRTELVEVVQSYNRMLDKIEEAYERQKQFVSDASHELRTPLAVIAGYSDILSRWGAEDPAVTREAVDAIVTQTGNMQTLLERLLLIARSDSGNLRPEIESVPLAPLCNEILQDFRMMHPDRTYTLAGEAQALCDPGMMRQIVVILLDNASKFTAEGGEIAVRLYTEGAGAVLEVADNGAGMEPEVAARIFERFYKADSSRNARGYGLGLPIARQMLEAQKGTIAVTTAPGEGSTFRIVLQV